MEMVLPGGVFLLVPLLFFTVGLLSLIDVLRGLLTGGPRALTEPGKPHLYDRVYYLLGLVKILGWIAVAIAFFGGILQGDTAALFEPALFASWAVGAIGGGLQEILRSKMMLQADQYLAQHGFILMRFSHQLSARQQARGGKYFMPLLGSVFVVTGTVILVANWQKLPLVLPVLQAHIAALLNCLPGV